MTNNQLNSIVQRIEKLEDERDDLRLSIKDIYTEAKSLGFDVKVLKKVIAMRKQDTEKRQYEQAMIDSYMAALGMLADTPLGRASIERAKVEQ
jgi:uncharacterized protein (UPF0335 family)